MGAVEADSKRILSRPPGERTGVCVTALGSPQSHAGKEVSQSLSCASASMGKPEDLQPPASVCFLFVWIELDKHNGL